MNVRKRVNAAGAVKIPMLPSGESLMQRSLIGATGSYLPDRVIQNEDLTQFPADAIPLIGEKTGVFTRRFAGEGECTSDLASRAAIACLDKISFPPGRVEGIILSTSSPDRMQPATATRVQHLIGAEKAFAFDINSVCSGSVYGIALANAMIQSGSCGNVLLIASEVYSKIMNPRDFSTYPFFGDGSGAVLFQAGPDAPRGVLHSCLRSDGSGCDMIGVRAGGTMLPYEKIKNFRLALFSMKGIDVFNFAVERGAEIILQTADEAGVALQEIRCFVCHQANTNIIRRISERLSLPAGLFFENLHRYGNTASASVLISLDEILSGGVVAKGDLVMTVAFGGGLSWGANLIRV
jgi:3-oxoacyl-[acyl-carrier-protein] synthase-3